MSPRHRSTLTLLAAAELLSSSRASAQEPDSSDAGGDPTELAKATQNPVSDLISLPLQFNFNSGGGLGEESIIDLNVQPVIPISVTPRWNVIARAIVPILNVPGRGTGRDTGLGDLQIELFATPTGSSSLFWGLGPIVSIPTATIESRMTGSWGVGPAGVAVYMNGPWVVGALATQTWTFADYGDGTEVNQFLVQPFVNFNVGKGWAISTAPMITASWDAPSGNEWTVPVGGGLTWTTKIGSQPMNLGAQYYYNVERPDGAPQNQVRLVISFLFPNQASARTVVGPVVQATGSPWLSDM